MAAFTTVAAGIGLAAALGSTGMSFAQAGKQKKLAAQAKAEADMAMAKAKQALDVNFYASQGIKKEPYELEREALLSQGAQAIEAGVQSERGAAATAGKVQMAMNEGQAGIRTAMGNEMTALENKKLAEDSRLRDVGVQINLGEAEGAQLAARDAEEARAAAINQGVQGITSLASQVGELAPLFEKSASAKQFGKLQSSYGEAAKSGKLGSQFKDVNGNPIPFQQAVKIMGGPTGTGYGFDVSGLGGMEALPFQNYMTGQSAQNLKKMSGFDFSK